MKSIVLIILLFLSVFFKLSAQNLAGEITYEKVMRYTRLYSQLTFLTKEEKDRMKMTWGNKDENTWNMKLYFSDNKSLYTYPSESENDGSYSWNKTDYRIYRDYEAEKHTDIIEMVGKTYIIEDSIVAPKWKVMNKIKEIGGYMCMMAVTEDTIKNQKITAWFADNIPISAGPELYSGLPGLILELDINDGDLVITAKKIELKAIVQDLKVPQKLKGKKLNNVQYNQFLATHIQDSFKAHRAWFWTMPY